MRGLLWAGAIWTLLIGFLWFRDRKHKESGWLRAEHIALAFALLGTHAVAGRTEADEVLRDPVVLERVVRGGLAALAVIIALPRLIAALRNTSGQFTGLTAFGTYVGIAGLSILYSAAWLVSAAKLFELLAGALAVTAVALGKDGRKNVRQTLTFVILLEGALLLVSVVGFFADPAEFAPVLSRPGFVTTATMSAPFAHPNGLSAIAALIAAYAYANLLQRNRPTLGWGFAFLVGTIGTVLAAGRQGVAIWFLSIVVLSVAHQRLISLVVIIPALALGITGWWNEILMVLARGRPQSLTSLSGRIGWWQGALDVWSVHPWTGYGYGAGGRFVALSSLGHSATSSVHNGYLEALVGVGLLGFLPLLYVVGRNMRWSVERLRVRNETEIGILMIPLLLRTAVSLGFAGWLNQDVIMLVCLTALVDLDRRVQRTRSAAVHKPRGQLESQTATVN